MSKDETAKKNKKTKTLNTLVLPVAVVFIASSNGVIFIIIASDFAHELIKK